MRNLLELKIVKFTQKYYSVESTLVKYSFNMHLENKFL